MTFERAQQNANSSMTHSSSTYIRLRCIQKMLISYHTVFHAQLINVHLQSRLDTYFNKEYYLVYGQDKEKQKDFKNVMS